MVRVLVPTMTSEQALQMKFVVHLGAIDLHFHSLDVCLDYLWALFPVEQLQQPTVSILMG